MSLSLEPELAYMASLANQFVLKIPCLFLFRLEFQVSSHATWWPTWHYLSSEYLKSDPLVHMADTLFSEPSLSLATSLSFKIKLLKVNISKTSSVVGTSYVVLVLS